MRQDRRWKYFLLASLISLVILPAASLWAAPNPASGLTATALSATQIRLDWTDNSTDETYFFIERKTGAGGTYTSIGNVGGNISTFTNTSLTPSTEYYYRVRVYNATGYSEYSNEVAATTLTLNAPTNLSASAVSYTQVTLTWADNSSEETSFSIERKTGAGGTYAQVATTAANATSYTTTGLTQGTEYYFRVRAVSGPNYSQYSSELKVTTQTLNPPSNVTVTPLSAVQIRLDWTDNSTDEMYFFLERKTGSGGTYTSIGNVGANVTTFTNTGLTQGTEYYYRVRAYNNTGIYSTYSTEASGTTLTLNAPTSLAIGAVSYTQVTLAWADNSSEETSFSIERKTGAGGTYAQVATTAANATSYTTTGLTQGTEYYFRVRAISGTNNSQYSNEVNATTQTLNAPSSLTVTPLSAVQIRLDWTDNSTDETSFYIERKTGTAGTYAYIGNVGANVTTFANTGLTQGTEYYYRVRAYNNTGNYSVYSNEASAITSTMNAPSSLAVGAVSYAQVTLAWADNSSEETSFSIERKTGAGGTYAQVATAAANAISYTTTGLTQGTEYYFRVRAVSGANYSGYSNEVNATTITLHAPLNLTVTPLSATQIKLDWTDNSTDETYFYIEQKIGAGGTYTYVGNVGANVTTYTSASLTQNTTYYYRVRAYNNTGNYSVYSNEASANTSTMNAPASLATGAVSYAQITISWTDNSSEETGFSIERKTGAAGTYAYVGSVGANVTTFTSTGLTQGTEYYFRVRAVSGSNYSGYTNEVNATTITLNAPSNLTVTPLSASQIRVDWTDSSTDETYFYIERKTGAGGTYTSIGNVGANVTTYTSSNLTQNTEYYYRVRAYNSTGNYSTYSNEASATTSPLAAPSNLSATATSTSQIAVTWTDNSNEETGFSIERKTGVGGTYAPVGSVGANVTTFTNTGLTHGTEYYYRVRTVSGSNYSEYSNEVSATPSLLPPSNLTATPLTPSEIVLAWNDTSGDETVFYIEYRAEGTDVFTTLTSVPANTTAYIHKTLTPDTTYHYRVRAYGLVGYSPYSNEASATTPAAVTQGASDSAGAEFFVAFQPNTAAGISNLSLFITGKQDTLGVVEIPGLNFTQGFAVQANKVTTVTLPNSAQSLGTNTVAHLGVRVVAQNEITVYGLNQKQFTTDAFLALPVDILGLEYLAMSYQGLTPSQVAVVGVYDNTQVTITPSAAATGRSAGVPFTITLNRQDTFQLTGSGTTDLTGSIITASAPVAVMSGVDCANVPVGNPWCDHIVEMMPPVTTWGKSFLTVPLATRLKGDVFRILASQDNTTVHLNGVLETTLNRGKFLEKVLTARTQIEASAPVLVAQYSPGQSFDSVVSDPFMMLIPPTEQFLNQNTFSTPATGFTANFVNIVVPSTAISSLRLDGASIDTTQFSSIGSSGFSGAQVSVALGSHTIIGDVPFGIYVYGFGNYDSYGYPGGMAFQFINPMGDTSSPNIRLIQVGDSIQGTATDSEDINANGTLDPGEDLNHNGIINRRSEDVNGNGVLDPGEDLNGNGHLDRDTGVFKVELAPGSTNLQLTVTPFIPGALSANFTISLLDPNLTGTGTLRVSDGVGNVVEKPIFLSKYSVLKDVRIIDTIATQGIEVDAASFSKTPYSITTSGASTVIEWRFDYFPVNLTEGIGFDVIMKTPVNGEHRLVSQKLELRYTDVNGNQVRTELGPQYVNVLNSAFDSAINTDKPAYLPNEDVNVSATIKNLSGYARIINAKVQIEDLSGTLVKEVGILSSLSFNPHEVKTFGNLIFNTGSTYAGEYRAHLILYENQKQIGETFANFQIQRPTNSLSSRATVDKVMYNPNENATITSLITSLSSNYIFENLTGRISIRNPIDNSQLFTDTKNIITLMPGAGFSFKAYWNTGTYAAGSYPVTLEVRDSGGALISTATNAITITSNVRPSTQLRGQISVDKQSIMTGETVTASYSVTNIGNINLQDVGISVLTINTKDLAVYDTISDKATLNMGGSYQQNSPITATNFSAKDYLVVLRAKIGGTEETLASTYLRVEGAPTAPSLSAPTNGASMDSFTPALSVNNASDPNDDKLTYEFELYTDSGLTVLEASSGSISEASGITTWQVPLTLTENATYYWRSRAYDGKLYGPWMSTASFRVNTANDSPTAPIISSPADNGIVSSLTPELTVLNATDPDSPSLTYNFDLALDSGFTQVVSSTTGIAEGMSTTSWQVPVTLAENTTYYWRSQADDWIVEGPWSITGRFFVNTVNEPPSTPVIIAPVKGASLKALEEDITVQNSIDPDSPGITYTFELDTVMSFDSPAIIRSGNIQQGQNSTTWHVAGLTEDTQYYVRAMASDGQAESAWSGIVDFFTNVTNSAPTAPTLANPSSGAGVNVFTPTLAVHNSTDPDRDVLTYEFTLYSDAAMTNLVAQAVAIAETEGTTSWTTPAILTENMTYYWHARAFDGVLRSNWMPMASFTVNTANDAPGPPTLSSPATGSSVATLTPTLAVSNALDPDNDSLTYQFEIYAGTTLVSSTSGVAQDNSGATSWTPASALNDNTLYQWRARAFDGDSFGPWMPMASFTIHLPQTGISATIDFDPDTLNKSSNGTWVVVYIELPTGFKPADIDISSIRLEGTIPAETRPSAIGDHDRDGIPDLMVKFKRSDVINRLNNGDPVPVHVTGKVGPTTFEGVDLIRVIQH